MSAVWCDHLSVLTQCVHFFLFQCFSQRTCRRQNQRISIFWYVLCRGSEAAGRLGESKQTNFWLLRVQHWKTCATTHDHQGALLEDKWFWFFFLVSRKQRMLGCWWTPGVSLQTFNSNIVLTDFGKEFMRGQIWKATVFGIELIIQFFLFFPRCPSIPPETSRTTFLFMLFTSLFFLLLFVSSSYVENLEFLTFQLTQSYWNVHFVAAPPFWYDYIFSCL